MKNQANVIIKKGCHSRKPLSGIYNARCCQIKKNALLNRCMEDPRVLRTAKSGMTPNLMGFILRPSSSRSVSMRDIGAAPRGFTARSVTPQCRYAGYSGRTGFTLIELLVVVLIVGILAAVAVPQYQKAVIKSRVATILPVVKNIADALEIYYLQNGAYPTTGLDGLDISLPSNCTPVEQAASSVQFACGNDFLLDMTGGTSRANYCPKKNTIWTDCKDSREFQITLIGNHYYETERQGDKLCTVMHNSTLGKQICANLAGFECFGC